MAGEYIEKDLHRFWLNVCGIDTHIRGSTYGQLDTPWNAFNKEGVLVCTLWEDQIVKVFDKLESRFRQFVRIGGRRKAWSGVATMHGEAADKNLQRATKERLRVVGFEAHPNARALLKDKRQVDHFFLNRVHELKRVFDLTSHDLITRLDLDTAFDQQIDSRRADESLPSYLFELVDSAVDFVKRVGIDQPDDTDLVDQNEAEDSLFEPDDESITQMYATKALPILVRHVLEQVDDVLRPLTYLQLAELLDRRNKNGDFWARGLGHVLGRVTTMVEKAQPAIPETIPYLTTIVVSSRGSERGLPAVGVRHRWSDYPKYSRPVREAKVTVEYGRILQFGSRWLDVLSELDLLPEGEKFSSSPLGGNGGGWGGGESDQHKALKAFVKANPSLVGATDAFAAYDEYPLRSGDEIDVFFESDAHWIGVEVKSSVSDGLERDYQRGLYQVVKYRAVLEAQAAIDRPQNPPKVTVILVLENTLPERYRSTAQSLSITVIEDVKPSI